MEQIWLFPQKQRDNYLRPLPHNFLSVYERLYRERTVILAAQSNYRLQMWQTVSSLLELYDSKSKDPIRVFIDAPSLGAQESLVLSKILQVSPVEVYTTLIGPVGLGPALILAGGTQGKRVAFPNSKISFDTTGLPLDTASVVVRLTKIKQIGLMSLISPNKYSIMKIKSKKPVCSTFKHMSSTKSTTGNSGPACAGLI